jgi:hypothetical protein
MMELAGRILSLGEMINVYNILVEKPEALEDLGVDRIILK